MTELLRERPLHGEPHVLRGDFTPGYMTRNAALFPGPAYSLLASPTSPTRSGSFISSRK